MNGWRFAGTLTGQTGDRFDLELESIRVGFEVTGPGTLSLQLSPAGDGSVDPVVPVAPGALAVAALLDVDRPAARPEATVHYWVNGQPVGSRVGRLSVPSPVGEVEYPLFIAGGGGAVSVPGGLCARFRRSVGRVSGDEFGGWDSDAAAATSWTAVGDGLEATEAFAIRPPIGGPPVRLACGAELIARLVSQPTAPGLVQPRLGIFRRLGADDGWQLVHARSNWVQTGLGGVRWVCCRLIPAPRDGVLLYSLGSWDLGGGFAGALPAQLDRFFGRVLLAGDETDPVGDTLPLADHLGSWPDRLDPGVVSQQRGGLEQVYLALGLPEDPKARRIVAGDLRELGDGGTRAQPWLERRPDGRFEVGAIVGGAYRSWISADAAARGWQAGRDDDLGDAGELIAPCSVVSRDGRRGMAAYDAGAARFVALRRGSPDEPWVGPEPIGEACPTAAAPYLIHRPDGLFEAGWLLGDAWHRHLSADLVDWWETGS